MAKSKDISLKKMGVLNALAVVVKMREHRIKNNSARSNGKIAPRLRRVI